MPFRYWRTVNIDQAGRSRKYMARGVNFRSLCRVVKLGAKDCDVIVLDVGVRHVLPTQSVVDGKPGPDLPRITEPRSEEVVDICWHRLVLQFGIAVGIAEQKVCKRISCRCCHLARRGIDVLPSRAQCGVL